MVDLIHLASEDVASDQQLSYLQIKDTIQDAILPCAQKPAWVRSIYSKEPTPVKWKTDMLRSIGKESGESVESVLEKKRKAMVGRICRKGRFQSGMKEWGVMDDESGVSMEPMEL